MTTFKVGDYAETDRHYGRISEIWANNGYLNHLDCELVRLECLHGPQKKRCALKESVCVSQLKHAPSPEELEEMIYVS